MVSLSISIFNNIWTSTDLSASDFWVFVWYGFFINQYQHSIPLQLVFGHEGSLEDYLYWTQSNYPSELNYSHIIRNLRWYAARVCSTRHAMCCDAIVPLKVCLSFLICILFILVKWILAFCLSFTVATL